MKRVRVEIPFHRLQTDTDHVHGDEIVVSDEELARIRAVNINMVSILGEVTEQAVPEEKKPTTRKKKQ
jgi:hypothetical protein